MLRLKPTRSTDFCSRSRETSDRNSHEFRYHTLARRAAVSTLFCLESVYEIQ